MKRIIILIEGDTEEEFVKSLLAPYLFDNFGVFDVRGIKIATSRTQKGGIGSYGKFRNDVVRYLNQDKKGVVSSLLDFFRLPSSFPKFDEISKVEDYERRILLLEEAMANDIGDPRFLPYLQKFEFEALLFAGTAGFGYLDLDKRRMSQIQAIVNQYPNPEDINDGPQTAPSKRLEAIVPGYEDLKILYGNLIFEGNGMQAALKKCPRFAAWVKQLGHLAIQ